MLSNQYPAKCYVAWWEGDGWGEVSEVFGGYDLASKWIMWRSGYENVERAKIHGFMSREAAEHYKLNGEVQK